MYMYTTRHEQELRGKLRVCEGDSAYLTRVVEGIVAATGRQAFDQVVREYGARLYAATAMDKAWWRMESRCLQQRYDTMLRVRGDFDSGIRMLKGELSRVRGNLNSDCQGYEAKMTGEMVEICRDEKTAVGPMVIFMDS